MKGSARLVLPDGTQLRPDDRRSADLGGYDYRAAKTQSCDLYFDGLPAGTSQVELEFFWQEVGTQQEEVLASFTLDLANQEITAAGTQGVELGSTQYSLLETGDTGWEENGFTVKDVWFSQAESYTGHVYFYLPDDCLETNLQVEVQNAQGETLFRSQAYGEDGASNPDWTLQPAFAIANLPQPLNICQVTQRLTGAVVPVGRLLPVERAGELPEKPHLRHGPHLEAALPLGQGLRQDGHSQAGFGCLGQSSGTGALQQGLGRQALLGKYPVYRAAQAAARFPQEQGQGRQLFYGGRGGKAPPPPGPGPLDRGAGPAAFPKPPGRLQCPHPAGSPPAGFGFCRSWPPGPAASLVGVLDGSAPEPGPGPPRQS